MQPDCPCGTYYIGMARFNIIQEAFEWRKEMERKQKSLLGKDASDQYLAGLEDQLSKVGSQKKKIIKYKKKK